MVITPTGDFFGPTQILVTATDEQGRTQTRLTDVFVSGPINALGPDTLVATTNATAFGVNGGSVTRGTVDSDYWLTSAIQPDGKIVAAGFSQVKWRDQLPGAGRESKHHHSSSE